MTSRPVHYTNVIGMTGGGTDADLVPGRGRAIGTARLRRWRIAGIAIGAVASIGAVVATLNVLRIGYPLVTLDFPLHMIERIDATMRFGGVDVPRLVVLGDSTVITAPPRQMLPDRLFEEITRQRGSSPMVMSLATHAASTFDYFPIAQRIAEGRPEAVIIGFNLASLSADWRHRLSRRETYGWLSAEEIASAARGPIYFWGLTFDALLLYKSFVELDLTRPWLAVRREQARTGTGLDVLRQRLQSLGAGAFGGSAETIPLFTTIPRMTRRRPTRARIEDLYSPALYGVGADSPLLVFYGKTLRVFADAGVPVLVYVVPANVEHMRRLGVDTAGLDTTSRSVCAVAQAHDARCVDLHAELSDDWFADAGGHFTTDSDRDGMRRVARGLLPAVLEIIRGNERAGKGTAAVAQTRPGSAF